MDPRDFLQVAIRLASRTAEADRRSSVSRAYYAVFHIAKQFLEKRCGVCLPVNEQHAKVAQCFQSGGKHAAAKAVGSMLAALRDARRIADYDMDDDAPNDARWANQNLLQAQRIVDGLDECSNEPVFADVCAGVRKYAISVQQLILRDPSE